MIFFQKIVNVSLAMVLLVATTGVTLNKHYCMGRLMTVAINEHAPLCSDKEEPDSMPCCEDVSQELKVEEITKASFDFDAQPDLFELAIVGYVIFSTELFSVEKDHTKYYQYSPPLIDLDIQVLDQVFLI